MSCHFGAELAFELLHAEGCGYKIAAISFSPSQQTCLAGAPPLLSLDSALPSDEAEGLHLLRLGSSFLMLWFSFSRRAIFKAKWVEAAAM